MWIFNIFQSSKCKWVLKQKRRCIYQQQGQYSVSTLQITSSHRIQMLKKYLFINNFRAISCLSHKHTSGVHVQFFFVSWLMYKTNSCFHFFIIICIQRIVCFKIYILNYNIKDVLRYSLSETHTTLLSIVEYFI